MLLVPESNLYPLTLASVLACAGSLEEFILILNLHNILLVPESNLYPLTLASVLSCADSVEEFILSHE